MIINNAKLFILFIIVYLSHGRIHNIEILNDVRKYISLSTFGFYKGGILDVKLQDFIAHPMNKSDVYGFSLDRKLNDAINPYDEQVDTCLLERRLKNEHDNGIIYFTLDFNKKVMVVNCTSELKHSVHIYKDKDQIPNTNPKYDFLEDKKLIPRVTRDTKTSPVPCGQLFPITSITKNDLIFYSTSFVMYVATDLEEGLYNLYFHSCPSYSHYREVSYDFKMKIIEENAGGSFLSAGEMPLPALYCTMSVLFFLSGCFWVFLLKQSRHPVFKIHYLMAALVFIKSISLAFHGVNYHFIEVKGVHLATWAVLFYVAHLLKGALLFITLVLIGTGWTFIKHVLAPRDKRLFMAVIPLQVLANVADIILQEGEEGAREYRAWQDVFILVDLLCCGCILFPVVWSIRHLQEASQTDGKAAVNLKKLKLFRHFYVMIVCYIYFTRIIVYLLRITVPFQYGWLHEMFREMATYVFFVLTGYKFRPAAHNPYFSLPSDDEEEDEVVYSRLSEIGAMEGVSRVNVKNKPRKGPALVTEVTEEDEEALLPKKESSHEYD